MSRRSVKKYFRELGHEPVTWQRAVVAWLFLFFLIVAIVRALLAE